MHTTREMKSNNEDKQNQEHGIASAYFRFPSWYPKFIMFSLSTIGGVMLFTYGNKKALSDAIIATKNKHPTADTSHLDLISFHSLDPGFRNSDGTIYYYQDEFTKAAFDPCNAKFSIPTWVREYPCFQKEKWAIKEKWSEIRKKSSEAGPTCKPTAVSEAFQSEYKRLSAEYKEHDRVGEKMGAALGAVVGIGLVGLFHKKPKKVEEKIESSLEAPQSRTREEMLTALRDKRRKLRNG